MNSFRLIFTTALLSTANFAAPQSGFESAGSSIPRAADGKPNLEGLWQASSTAAGDLQDHAASLNILAGRSVVVGKVIPYQPWALEKKVANAKNRLTADPLSKCYMPGVPRIMYLEFPFQIFQTPAAIGMAFEWALDHRLIHMNGTPHFDSDWKYWLGDSRGHWEGDVLVVDVANNNDQTWLDAVGDFHSDELHVVERYRMTDSDTIQYEATLEDAKVFTRPWTIQVTLRRRIDRDRLFEYSCQSEVEEVNGAFPREERTWYPGNEPVPSIAASTYNPAPVPVPANIRRMPDGKPDFQGFYENTARGANQGLEKKLRGTDKNLIVDPADGKLPMRPWAIAERESRRLSERGYDDPTAHCFPAGVPRALYVPEGFQIIQTPQYIFMMFERVSWRIIPLDQRPRLPDHMRLWQGDSIGHWEGDTLVVETTNLNGKTWVDEGGEIVSHAEHVIERFTPAAADLIQYEATVTDPIVYTRPWTVSFGLQRENFELHEAACHEEDHDLPHLKAIKDAAAARKQ